MWTRVIQSTVFSIIETFFLYALVWSIVTVKQFDRSPIGAIPPYYYQFNIIIYFFQLRL